MDPLPPAEPQPYIKRSKADETIGFDLKTKVAKGTKKWRLILPGTEKKGRIAVTIVPEITFKSFGLQVLGQRMAAIMEWIVNPTATMRVPDPNQEGKFMKIYVNLNSVKQRVHIRKKDFRLQFEKKIAAKRDALTEAIVKDKPEESRQLDRKEKKQVEQELAQFATEAVLQVLQEAVATRPIEDFIRLCYPNEEGKLTVTSTGQYLGFTAHDLRQDIEALNQAWPSESEDFYFEGTETDKAFRASQVDNEILLLSKPTGGRLVATDILHPTIKREYCLLSRAVRNDQQVFAKATGKAATTFTADGLKVALGPPYVETARNGLKDRTKSEIRDVVPKGLVQTLELLDKMHAQNTKEGIALIDVDHVVLRPDGRWSLNWETEESVFTPEQNKVQERQSLADAWVHVIMGGADSEKTKLSEIKVRLKTLGFSKAEVTSLSNLLEAMKTEGTIDYHYEVGEEEGTVTVKDALAKVKEIFEK